MELDKGIFSALEACNPRWTDLAGRDEESTTGIDVEETIMILQEQVAIQSNEIAMLRSSAENECQRRNSSAVSFQL